MTYRLRRYASSLDTDLDIDVSCNVEDVDVDNIVVDVEDVEDADVVF